MLQKLILKEKKGNLISKEQRIQVNDSHIWENSRPSKVQVIRIPQKPTEVYDCINNVNRVFHPPSLELVSHSTYRDNTIRGKQKTFNKNMGYFSYFNEKTRREREMNQMYSRKILSKFTDKIRNNALSDRNHEIPELKQPLRRPVDDNARYAKGSNWMHNSNNSLRMSGEKKPEHFDVMQTRRASNQVEPKPKSKIQI